MNEFFRIFTYTPWDGLNLKELTEVKLVSVKNIFNNYPIIEKEFFKDLSLNLKNHPKYSWFESIRRIIGPEEEDYSISSWRFIWALDNENRMYQFLVQKIDTDNSLSQAALAGLAPPELAKLFSEFKGQAIHKTFSLLNIPSKIKFLIYLTPKGKSIAEEVDSMLMDQKKLDKMNYIRSLANQPNIQGQWFPYFEIRCPACNKIISTVSGSKIGFGNLTCPFCGYKKG